MKKDYSAPVLEVIFFIEENTMTTSSMGPWDPITLGDNDGAWHTNW